MICGVTNCPLFYTQNFEPKDEGPFLKEERNLLNAIAGRLGKIIERKHAEEALQKAHDELELRVKERTKELETKSINLEEVNTALKVLLKKRDEDKIELEQTQTEIPIS